MSRNWLSHGEGRIARQLRRVGLCCGLLALAGLAGCGGGGDDPFSGSYVKINGTVKYADGSLITVPAEGRVTISFNPINPEAKEGNKFPRPGSAELKIEDGTFTDVTSHLYGDGVVAGKYKVTIKALDHNQKTLADVIPEKYGDFSKTPIEIDTTTLKLPLELTVEKPVAGVKKR